MGSGTDPNLKGTLPTHSKWRMFLWPVFSHELPKFLPMLLLFFFVTFNYHILRILKDSLIITAPNSGAEVIPFLKVWAVLPSAIVTTFLFAKASSHFSREKLFNIVTCVFLLFFLVFALFLYPHKEALYLDGPADYLQSILPTGFHGLIALIRYWIYTLFYMMAESWSTIMLSILLWGFANEVTSISESKRFYALFGIGVNTAGIVAGKMGEMIGGTLTHSNVTLHPVARMLNATSSWDQSLLLFVGIIILFCLFILAIYRYLHVYVFVEVKKTNMTCVADKKVKRPHMSLTSAFTHVMKSKYILYIAIIVLSYNMVINLTEVLWKSQIKEMFPSTGDYTAYMGKITYYVGIIATFGAYFISGNLLRKFGWKVSALLTPLILLITSVFFFYFIFMHHYHLSFGILFGLSPLALSVFFGSLQNCFSRAAKYTIFDNTKEMAFIPLDIESKMKGKAAIDGVGSRLGKSGSSLLMQILLIFFSTPVASSPIICLIIFLVLPVWIKAINNLNLQFTAYSEKESKEGIETRAKEATL